MIINQIEWNVLLYLGLNQSKEYQTNSIEACKTGNLSSCNRVLIKRIPQEHDFRSLHDFMNSDLYTIWTPKGSDVDSGIKKNTSFKYSVSFPIMKISLASLKGGNYSDRIAVKQVKSLKELGDWIDIVTKVYTIDRKEFQNYIRYLETIITPEKITYWLAYWDGVPVATSMCIEEHTTVGIHWVATLADFRRRGIGCAVTYVPLLNLQNSGISHAILFASELGKSVYETLGFNTVLECAVYKKISQ